MRRRADMRAMLMDLDGLAWSWEQFAKEDPLWAIITYPEKRGGRWDPAEFFATGRDEIAGLMTYLGDHGLDHSRDAALDFGCGVGRLTQALADHYGRVVGVDISPTMIEHARRFNQAGERCAYVVNGRPDLTCLAAQTFDLVYTNIVLQHMAPALSLGYLREFLRLLAPGGVCVFQLPYATADGHTGDVRVAHVPLRRRWWQGLRDRLAGPAASAPVMEMHAVPKATVLELVAAHGARLVDVQENANAGDGHRSARYCVVRD